MTAALEFQDLGADVDFDAALALQLRCHAARRAGAIPDTLLLLEHARVYTLGRSADEEHILWDAARLSQLGIRRVRTSRGGDVTYHGPGQLVGYPIVHLSERRLGVLDFVTALEETLIRTARACGVPHAARDARNRGVWVGNDKLAAIGIHVSRQVTQHGFALNVNTALDDYAGIVACGLAGAGVTSLARLLGHAVAMAQVKRAVLTALGEVFDCETRPSATPLTVTP